MKVIYPRKMINVHNPSKTKDLYFSGNVLSIRYTITTVKRMTNITPKITIFFKLILNFTNLQFFFVQ